MFLEMIYGKDDEKDNGLIDTTITANDFRFLGDFIDKEERLKDAENERDKLKEKVAMLEKQVKQMQDFWVNTVQTRVTPQADKLFRNGQWGLLCVCTVNDYDSVSRWVSVKDRMPQRYENVLIAVKWNDKYVVDFGYIDECGEWTIFSEFDIRHKITHWMPLPKPPKED